MASESNMEGEKAEKRVRESERLCAGEQEFVNQRKKKVLECLKKLKINCAEDSVPHIALLGSGGGERAARALLGSLHQLKKEKLLDSVLYLGGVSGSTWSMAFLYTDPEWSMKMDEAIDQLMASDRRPPEAGVWLVGRSLGGLSLSDLWGWLTTVVIMKQLELGKLSEKVDKEAINPYPIYCASEDNCRTNELIEGMWFEMSPHEAGFPELGLFVETSLLGSEFKGGKRVKDTPEMDMVRLQGILGSALADKEKIREYISDWGIASLLMEPILSTVKWEWGTTSNFLYQFKGQNSSVPELLTSIENMNLVDAGLLINVPYQSFLGDKRDIDLIIALEYSAGVMFETLTLAQQYAKDVKKPFPDIDEKILAEKNYPRSCYVIEGKGKEPTIVYLPLFNRDNCKNQEECEEKMEKFTTFQAPYDEGKKNELMKIARENISKNRDVLLEQICKAAERRQNK